MRAAATMSGTAAASGFVLLLLSVPVVQCENGWGVRYTSTEICVLRGSTVDINCTYTSTFNNRDVTVQKTFWFIKDSNGIYVDLMTDPEYSGRVEYLCENNKCTLRISDLRETDSAVYKFSFTTNQDSFTGSAGVTLSVTDLHVQVNTSVEGYYYNYAKLKCQSSCRLPDHLTYVWYKNQQKKIEGASYSAWFGPADTVSCAVKGLEDFHSPSLLVRRQRGWNVRYTSTEICVHRGSTVDINCSYTYPSRVMDRKVTVQKTFWFKENHVNVDLKTQSQYSGRVEYLCENNKCTLRISHLRETDSAVYKFRFTTNRDSVTGSAGVTLNVTDPQLQVHVRRSTANPYPTWTELTCHSSCQLPDHLSYVWFKNNKQLVGRKKYFLLQHFNAGDNYHCAIEGHERFPSPTLNDPSDAPKVPSVSVSPSGEIMEGSSVTLTCSSDANPAANYTWYKEDEDSPRASGQNFTITNIRAEHGGNYQCEAQNRRGRSDASLHVTVGAVWTSAVIGSAAAAFLAVTLLAVTLLSVFFLIRKKRNSHQSPDPGDRLDHSEQRLPNQSEEDCDLHYGSVHFMKTETDPVYSNERSAKPSKHKEREEVAYASVNFNRSAPRTRVKNLQLLRTAQPKKTCPTQREPLTDFSCCTHTTSRAAG